MENKKNPEPVRANAPAPAKKAKTKPAVRKKRKPRPSAGKASGGMERLRRAAVVLLAIVAVCGIVVSALSVRSELLQKKVTLVYAGMLQKENVVPIALTNAQVRACVRDTKRHGDTYAFSYFCSRTLQLDADTMSGYILFGNPAGSGCDLVLSIFDGDGSLIYRSGGVTPGNYLTQIRFSAEDWESGSYPCRAVVTAYKGHDLQYKCIGAQYSRLTVKVGETS